MNRLRSEIKDHDSWNLGTFWFKMLTIFKFTKTKHLSIYSLVQWIINKKNWIQTIITQFVIHQRDRYRSNFKFTDLFRLENYLDIFVSKFKIILIYLLSHLRTEGMMDKYFHHLYLNGLLFFFFLIFNSIPTGNIFF